MRFGVKSVLGLALAAGLAAGVAVAQDSGGAQQPSGQSGGQRGGGRGQGMGSGRGMMGRGVTGTVTEVAADHFTVKNEAGQLYTIHFSANTRVMKQAPRPAGAANESQTSGGRGSYGGNPPQPIKATDIKVGDAIVAGGEVDDTAKSVGAAMIMQLDPERAKEMQQMQANFGKTWLMGKVTAVNETKVTLQSQVDNAAHTFVADENTTFRKRRDPITLADVQMGDTVRVDGAVKGGDFVATAVSVMGGGQGGPGGGGMGGRPQPQQ